MIGLIVIGGFVFMLMTLGKPEAERSPAFQRPRRPARYRAVPADYDDDDDDDDD